MREVPSRADAQRLAELLPPLLTRRTGRRVTAITELRTLSGGVSRHTWSFDAVDEDGTVRGLILQQRPGFALEPGIETSTEAALLTAAREAGVPVPELVVADPEGDDLGLPSLITERIEGETIPQRILRDERYDAARAVLASQYGEALGRLHRIPVEGLALTRQDPVEYTREVLDTLGDPHPALELGVRWLEHHRPPSGTTVVCHGDFRNGNGIVGPDGLRAVIDWELAHLGDPLEDVAWSCLRAWRFGHPMPVGGFGTYGEFVAAYERAAGRRVDPEAFHWWQVAGTLRWAALCAMQTVTSRSGTRESIEFTAVGRRICEAEFDLLLLLPTIWSQNPEAQMRSPS
ncbi:MAG: phosphotransferase [Propionibacteriales bacterium]|nr:phosphotransferase [Propionibacteriales bacterium]